MSLEGTGERDNRRHHKGFNEGVYLRSPHGFAHNPKDAHQREAAQRLELGHDHRSEIMYTTLKEKFGENEQESV